MVILNKEYFYLNKFKNPYNFLNVNNFFNFLCKKYFVLHDNVAQKIIHKIKNLNAYINNKNSFNYEFLLYKGQNKKVMFYLQFKKKVFE